MIRLLAYIAVFITVIENVNNAATGSSVNTKEYYNKIVNIVNSAKRGWVAGHNFDYDTINYDKFAGTLEEEQIHDESVIKIGTNGNYQSDQLVGHDHSKIPKAFDGRTGWPKCPSVNHIWDQGNCGSDWVIAPVAAITDRRCIFSNGTQTDLLSPETPLACCKSCGWGCKRGYPSQVYNYWVNNGLVTGGDYNSKKGCQPYSVKSCKSGKNITCFNRNKPHKTPKCHSECTNSVYSGNFKNDLSKGEAAFRIGCLCGSASEIAHHGPITATFNMYEDFLTYQSGVYNHVTGKRLGKYTVKLLGFNDTADPKYWIAAASFGSRFGDKGFFKVVRGADECGIEGSLRGAWVKIPDDAHD